jgi:hypothetical protein
MNLSDGNVAWIFRWGAREVEIASAKKNKTETLTAKTNKITPDMRKENWTGGKEKNGELEISHLGD